VRDDASVHVIRIPDGVTDCDDQPGVRDDESLCSGERDGDGERGVRDEGADADPVAERHQGLHEQPGVQVSDRLLGGSGGAGRAFCDF